MSWMPGDVSASSVRIGRRRFVTNCSPTCGKSRPTYTRVCSALWYSRRLSAQNANTSATWPPFGSITRMRSPRASSTARPSRAGTVMVVVSAMLCRTRNSPSWLAFRPPAERAFELPLRSSVRLRPTRLPSTAQWSSYGTGPPLQPETSRSLRGSAPAVAQEPGTVPGCGACASCDALVAGHGRPCRRAGPKIRRRGWPFVPRPKELSSHLYSSSARLRPTRLPSTAQWSSYGTAPTVCNPKFHARLRSCAPDVGPVELPPHARLHHQRHGGRRRHHELGQRRRGAPLYDEGRTLYTEEINAAVRGARAGGATEVVVMDCHGAGGDRSFNSLRPELLDDGCEFVVQKEWTEYTGVLEEGCDAALFVGMHAMAGTGDGLMSHTVSGTEWRSVQLQRPRGRRDGHQRRAVRHLGLPGAARHRRPGGLPRGPRAARRRADHRRR